MEYSVYVLKSLKNGKRYIGMTSKSARERLAEHNNGSNKHTRENGPYKLVYYEKGYCSRCARKREEFLKSGVGKQILDMIIKSERSSVG